MKQTIEQRRTANRATRFAAMTERELTVELQQVAAELDDNRLDYRLKLNHGAIRDHLRAEIAARRRADDFDAPTDEQMDAMGAAYQALNAAAADEVQDRRDEMARLDARDALIAVDATVEPF